MHRSRLSRRWVSLAVSTILFVLLALSVLDTLAQHNPLEEIRTRVTAAGSYRFVADVEQTLAPRPLPEMIGQTSQRVDVRLEGEVALPDRAQLNMRLEGGGLDASPLSLVQSAGQTFAQVDGELQPIDNPYALAAPGNDFLQYLEGAAGLQAADGDGHFTFAVDGQRLAEAARDQMQTTLEKSGQLPAGVEVASSPALANVSGQGELWLDADGLPRRLALDLEQPGVSPEYDARAHIVVDFADYGQVDSLPQPVQNEDGTWRVEQQPVANGSLSKGGLPAFFQTTVQPSNLLLLLVCFGIVASVRLYRRHRRQVYVAIAIVAILSFVATPLLQAGQTARFFERYAYADDQPSTGQPAPLPTPNRHSPTSNLQPPTSNLHSPTSNPPTTCGDGDPNTDTDGDGLNDRDENCLGTDPGHADSDRDTITDTLELDGIEFPAASGQMWYGDPLKADSNEDGLLDSYEWPDPYGSAPEWDTDSDGIPAPWDDDNDGDGVPDSLDLAPYAYSDYGDSFSLSTQGGGFDGYEFIEIQVQPQDAAHLRYSLSALDWPYDYRGQVRDLNSSKEDVRLVPILQITTNTAPDKEMAANYGVSMVENDDGSYTLYAALSPLDNGGQITAFAAKVAYEPEKLDDIRWTEARLVWIAQMQNDTYQFRNPGWQLVTQSTPLVTYTDSFRVTGLQVSKGKDFESAILGTPTLPNDDRDLFQAALAAGSTFMSYQTPTLADVADRFANTDPNADPLYTWGLHPADVDEDMPQTYANRDEGLADTNQRAFDFLGAEGYAHSSNPSLFTLMEEDIGVWIMSEGGSGQVAAQFNVDLDNISLTTQRSAKLTTYDYQDNAWQPMSTEDTLHLMQDRYDTASLEPVRAGLESDYPDLTTADLQTTVLMFYTAWLNGRNKVSQVDADQLLDPAPADLDQQTYDAVHLPQSKYDNLSAYLLEAAELGEPGGGFRLGGSPAQAWDYQHAHGPTVDAFSISPLDFSIFYEHLQNLPDVPLPRWEILTGINLAKFAFAAYTARQLQNLMKAGELATPISMDKLCNHKLGAITAGVTLLVIWITFAAGTDFSNPFVWKTALAYAIAASIFTLLTFAMSFFPGFAIWLAIFVLVDLIVLLATWGRFSITGKVIEWLSKAFYEVRLLTSFEDMDFKNARGALKNENIGIVSGNSYVISQTFEGTIKHTEHADADDIDDSTAYASFVATSSQASPASERGSTTCRTSGDETVCTNQARAEFYFDQAHRNIRLETDTRVHTLTYYEECKLWGASCKRSSVIFDLPDDLREDQRRQWTASDIYIDVLPNTVGGLWTWDEISAPDRDGDGLSNAYEADLGTNPDLWDTDGDGLDDKFEVDNHQDLGCDPLAADTDGDGLSDSLEYRLKTGIDQPDSDDDGLLDGEEVFHQDIFDTDGDSNTTEWLGGWLVDDLPETTQAYWVSSDPTQADADDDGLNDKAERAYHTSPNAYNEAPRLELDGDPLAVAPDGDEAAYLEPGDTVTFDLSLDSVGPDPISAVVTLCLPDFLTNLQGGEISGDRTPTRQVAASCNGFQWDFTGANTLQTWESVTTSVTAVAANVASARGEAVVSFPYQMGEETQDIEARVGVVLDNENPSVSISAPEDGELIGGGVSEYVVGGNAGDETSWVDHVGVQLPVAGTVTAEGENPWAYTWSLPADGVYDLAATAYDYLGYASAADTVQVTVDNTAPGTTLDLADGATVTAQAGGVITIPLSGTASDNLTGLARVQISLDGKPWREVWTSDTYPLNATWTANWTLPNEDSASGEHVVMVRAVDRAGNYSDVLQRTIVVDVLPPTDELGNRIFQADPPHLPTGQQVDLYGVANDAGNAPAPSRPEELLGTLDGLFDATIWLGLPTVFDNDDGVQLAWLGDFNNDRLADLAVGLPAAEGDDGRVVVVYGRAGDWPAPDDVEPIADSRTSFVGKRGPSAGGGLGATLSAAGDVNGDGIADLLIGDPSNRRFFLAFGSTSALGRDLLLDGPADGRSVLRNESIPYYFGRLQAPAGDVNGDGLDDLLLGVSTSSTTMVYLLLGTPTWFDEVNVDQMAAARIDTGSRFSTFAGVGDVNGDEYDDFAVTSGTTVYLFLGDGDLASSPPDPTALHLGDADATFASATSDPQVVAAGDVNGDGLGDFVYQSGNAPQLVLGDSGGAWGAHSFDNLDPPASGFLAAPGDVDGDGRADLLLGNSHGDAYLVLGSDLDHVQATLTGVDGAASATAMGAMAAAGADLNSDGSSDLLLLPAASSGSGLGLASADWGELPFTAPEDLPAQYATRNTGIGKLGNWGIGEGRQVEAATLYVNDDAGCDGLGPCYATIQAAVDAAAGGDTIIVQPGAYESFVVDGLDNLTLSGTYADAVFVDGAGGPYAVKIQNATGVTLENMTLRDAQNAILLQDAGLNGYDNPSLITSLQSLLIYDFSEHAVSMNRASSAKLSQCTLAGGKNHIEVTGSPDPDSNPAWDATLSTTGMPASSDGGGLASEGGLLYLAPGAGSNAFSAYHPVTDTWSARADVPIQMTSGASNPAADGSGHVYLLPGSIWQAMGSGLGSGGVINDSLTVGSDLYLAGNFTQAGGVAVAHLARWDGSTWHDVGGGVSKSGGGAYLTALAADGSGNLYVAGDFDHAGSVSASRVAYWDGTAWHAVGSLPAVPTAVGTAVTTEGNSVLYAGSCALASGGISGGSDNLWQWAGGTWTSLASRCIHDLARSQAQAHIMFMATDTGVRRYSTEWGWRDWDSFFSGPVYTVLPLSDSEFFAGGDFTATEGGPSSENFVHIEYTCPGGGCSYNVIDNDGGVNDVVRALTQDAGNFYVGGDFTQAGGLSVSHVARWDGSAWHPLARGAANGTNAAVTALSRYGGYVYAAGDFSQAGGVSASYVARWSHPLYRYDVAGNSWAALAPLPQAIGDGCALAADGDGHVYALTGSDSTTFFQYDVAGGAWTSKADLPAAAQAGGALTYAHGYVYALRGGSTRSFYRYDPAASSWSSMASIPSTSGVAAAGADLAWDGHEWLYAVLGGNGRHFLRYKIALDQWEVLGDGSSGTSDDDDTPTAVSEGGALARLADGLYAIPGGGVADLWRFAPIGVYREKLQLDRVAFVVQETATQGDWYNLPLDGDMPEDFAVAGSDNVWIGGSATAWNPDPTVWPESRLNLGSLTTHDQAAFLDPDRNLYRLTAASTLAAGYATYQPDVSVPGDYASIQDAVLSGANRVTVDAGSYAQAFYLVSGVEVVGARADRTVLTPPGGHSGPLVTAEGVVGATLTGFTLDGANSFPGFRAEGGTEHLTLARSILRDTTTAIELDGADTRLEVVNNTVVHNSNGLAAQACAPLDVRNTIFAYHSVSGLTFNAPPESPIAHWPLDEAAGATSFADASGNGHTATCSGGTCPVAGAPGVHGSALSFDGVDDYVDAPTANPNDLQALTVAAWVNLDLMPSGQIERFVTLNSEKAVLRYDGASGPEQLHFYMTIDGSFHSIRVDHALQVRTWHHVAGTYDGHTMRLYLDGQQVGSLAIEGVVGGGTGVRLSQPGETLDGKLDDVRLYDRALSAGEIAALYEGCDARQLHTYNLFWANDTDLDPNEPGPAEIFLDPRFVDPLNDNYYTDDYSPVIDAGNPTDPHPPGTGENVDIGYIEQGRAAYYVDDDYCPDCLNDGLTWGVDAYKNIQPALDEARDQQIDFGNETAGDVTCRILRSDDVPLTIAAAGTDEVISALDVAQRGLVTDVNLHSLRGTHGRVSDLDIILESPSGTMARMLAPDTCNQPDFDLNFDDEVAAGSPPCPPDDGGTYQPVQSLSKFDGDHSDGTWLLHVRDGTDGEGGTLDAWGLEICARDLPPLLTVGVGPGTYAEAVSVPSYVRLVGIGADQATVDASGLGTPVTFDGVVHAEVSGLTLAGDGSSAGVLVRGGSNDVLIQRNLIRNDRRGLVFEQGGTGTATFNSLVGQSTSPLDAYGILANGTGSQVVAENNIVHNYRYGLYLQANGNIYSDYNLLAGNADNYGSGLLHGEHDLQRSSPGFVGSGDYHLSASSPAVDSASPHEPVPPGGGSRADIGYHELIALPAVLFLGREGISTAIGNSGLARVESAVVPVSDLYSAASETTPAAWDTVYDDPNHEQIKATWLLSDTLATEGLHRVYSRAQDAVGNAPEDAVDWYVGAFVTDGISPTVTWLAPAAGSVPTEVELRAQAWDEAVGQFSVETVQFEVDGSVVPAQWAAEPWDPAGGVPRVFRAWASLTLGTNPTVVAVAYDKAGNRGQSAPVVLNVTTSAAADTTAPSLAVSSPVAGSMVQPPVLFQGTASDPGGSGLASVQVSLDNGVTWLPAAVSGSDWSLSWDPPWRQDYVTYPAQVRARDKAGNATTQAVTFAVDNVPPTLSGRNTFYDVDNSRYIRPGQHLDYPTNVRIYVAWPWDGSDSGGNSLRYQYFVNQEADTEPDLGGTWAPRPVTSPVERFDVPGAWYVHIFYRDQAGNIAVHHYGPWYVADLAQTGANCNQRRQTIELDGVVDVANGEWADHEFLDDDERGMDQGYERQSLYAAWDGDAFYAAWQGAWWDVDGEMWLYLDMQSTSGDSGINHTVVYPYHDLPFLADRAVRVDGQDSATFYYSSGGSWYVWAIDTFAHGESGGTEIKIPWDIPLNTVMDVRMLAYAEDNDGQVWSMFPTTNPLVGNWNDYYRWNTLCDPIYAVNANQPTYTSLLLEIASDVAPDAAVGPGTLITYNLGISNMEDVTSTISTLVISATAALSFGMQDGATCDPCPSLGAWTLLVPPIAPGATYNITLTGQISDTLAGLSEFTISGTLGLGTQTLSQASITQRLDSLPPTLEVEYSPNQTVCTGPQTIRGSACDLANPAQTLCVGGGVDLVQYSLDGGLTWQDAEGTTHWSATITVPTGSPTFGLWVQAIDVFGQAYQELFPFNLDANPPTVTLDLPDYLTGGYTHFGGTAADGESAVVAVDVQMDTDTATWKAGQVYPLDSGSQKWQYTQVLPSVDGEGHHFRARATDAGCNASAPTGWQTARIDNVAPQLTITGSLDAVIGRGYPAGGSGEPVLQGVVADGSGVAGVQVQVIDTAGTAAWRQATLDGGHWTFTPQLTPVVTGTYRLRVQATDAAGNVRSGEAHDLYVCETIGCLIEHTQPTHHAWVPAGAYTETVQMDKSITLTLESDVRLSGTLTLSDGLWVAPSGVMTLTGDLDLAGGTFQHNNGTLVFDGGGTQTLSGSATFYNLTVAPGSTLVVDGDLVVEGTLTNNGTLQQTRDVNGNADVSFFNTGGYGGLTLNANGLDLGSTQVCIRSDQDCTTIPGETVRRCFDIVPANTVGRDATVTFFFASSELSGNDCNTLKVYHWQEGSWQALTVEARDCAASPSWLRVTGVSSFSPFVLKSGEPPDGDPTAVTLASFTATATDDGAVLLAWETASELDLLGFHLYRAEAVDGPQIRLDEELIPGQAPGSPVGAAYSFLDESVVPGQTYWYWLEDVDVRGVATRHGPLSATVWSGDLYRVWLPVMSK